MAYCVNLTARAERDLDALYEHIQATTSEQARHWYFGLRDAILTLRRMPERCPIIPENRTVRHLLYGRKPHVYRVIFRIEKKSRCVYVLHIRHGLRNRTGPSPR